MNVSVCVYVSDFSTHLRACCGICVCCVHLCAGYIRVCLPKIVTQCLRTNTDITSYSSYCIWFQTFFFHLLCKNENEKKQTRTKLSLKNVDPVVRNLSIFTKIKCTILQEIGTRSRYFWDGKCYRAKEDVFDEVERKTRAFAESINAWKPSTMLALAKRRKRNTIWETKRSGRKQDNSE